MSAAPDGSRFVDLSGDVPTLRVVALVTSAIGAVFWGWISGMIAVIGVVGDAITGAVLGVEDWLTSILIELPLGVLGDLLVVGLEEWAEFVTWVPFLGLPLSIALILIALYVLYRGALRIGRAVV